MARRKSLVPRRSPQSPAMQLEEYFVKAGQSALSFFRGRNACLLQAFSERRGDAAAIAGMRLESPADFAACARYGVTEIRVMNTRRDEPRRPDWMVLELIAPESAAESLFPVAEAAQDLLASLQLKFLWKPSGATSLQILIPLRREYDTTAIFDFSQMLAELIHERVPLLSSLKSVPGSQRVLIDYQGNRHARFVLAPFSPVRIGAGFGISLPVEWDELLPPLSQNARVSLHSPEAACQQLTRCASVLESAQQRPNGLENAFASIENLAQMIG